MSNVQQLATKNTKQIGHTNPSEPRQLQSGLVSNSKSSTNASKDFGTFTASKPQNYQPGLGNFQSSFLSNGQQQPNSFKAANPIQVGSFGQSGIGSGLGAQLNLGEKQEQQVEPHPEFNLSLQEYNYVFRVFDKQNTGEIHINQVQDLANKFEQAQLKESRSIGQQESGAGQVPPQAKVPRSEKKTHQNGLHFREHKHQMPGSRGFGETADGKAFSPTKRPYYNGSQTAGAINGVSYNSSHQRNGMLGEHKSPRRQSNLVPSSQKESAANQSNNNPGGLSIKLNGILPTQTEGSSEDGSPSTIKKKPLNSGGNPQQTNVSGVTEFPGGKETLKFDDFISLIKDSCADGVTAENYLVLTFSIFDRQKKGFINSDDLKQVFEIMGESVTDEEMQTMIKLAGVKSGDKINFKEFVDFFYKID